MQFRNELYPSSEAQMAAMREAGPKGPIVMVNLLKFKARAEYPDGCATALSGQEAYAIYGAAVTKLVAGVGGRVLFMADVTFLSIGQAEPLWDQVALAEYPDRAALVRMAMSEEYQEIAVHRAAGLAGQLNIETTPRFNLADVLARGRAG
ncbi:MAG TPA: DUF1330 domain-containing protein [Acetobacteraceae bacterium]|nr:DUF1330 domain-containing protein [Acetobacteraceae bacterium]